MSESGQKIIINDRKELSIDGVLNVDSFDEQHIELNTCMGGVDIEGEGMKIAALNLEEGEVCIGGLIHGVNFVKSREEKSVRHKSKNALSRLLK